MFPNQRDLGFNFGKQNPSKSETFKWKMITFRKPINQCVSYFKNVGFEAVDSMHGQSWHDIIAYDHAHDKAPRILGQRARQETARRRISNTSHVDVTLASELESQDHSGAGAQTVTRDEKLIRGIGAERFLEKTMRLEALQHVFGVSQYAQVARLIC